MQKFNINDQISYDIENCEIQYDDLYTPKSNINMNGNDEINDENEEGQSKIKNQIPVELQFIAKVDEQFNNFILENDQNYQICINQQSQYQTLTYEATMIVQVMKNEDNINFLENNNIIIKFVALLQQMSKTLNPFQISSQIQTENLQKNPNKVNFLVEFVVEIGVNPEIHNKRPCQFQELLPEVYNQQNKIQYDQVRSIVNYSLFMNPQYNSYPNDFEDLALIGQGCFGEVHLVKYLRDHNLYALKIIKLKKQALKAIKSFNEFEMKKDEKNSNNVLREILFLKRMKEIQGIKHPNIVRLHKYWLQEDTKPSQFFILLEYFGNVMIQNHTLFHYFQDYSGQFKPQHRDLGMGACKEVIGQIFFQAILAIKFIHSQNIVHRDIKDDNFLIKRTQGFTYKQYQIPFLFQIALCDFGMSGYGDRPGSLMFYDPNEFRDRDNIIFYPTACDIFSLGVLLERIIKLFITNLERINCWENVEKELRTKLLPLEYNLASKMKQDISQRPLSILQLEQTKEYQEWISSIPEYIPVYFTEQEQNTK